MIPSAHTSQVKMLVLGVAVMTDTDNTGKRAVGEYADIRFECAGK